MIYQSGSRVTFVLGLSESSFQSMAFLGSLLNAESVLQGLSTLDRTWILALYNLKSVHNSPVAVFSPVVVLCWDVRNLTLSVHRLVFGQRVKCVPVQIYDLSSPCGSLLHTSPFIPQISMSSWASNPELSVLSLMIPLGSIWLILPALESGSRQKSTAL